MTVVVTGVAGFIGSHVAERLLADGEEVVGIDCFTDYYEPSIKEGNLRPISEHPRFQLARVDLATDDLSRIKRATHVYHLAGQPGVRGSWGDGFANYMRNNIAVTQRLAEALRGSTTKMVCASSSSVYGDADDYPTAEDCVLRPSSPYGVTKLAAEQLVLAYRRTSSLDARCVRYFTVYGPRQRPDMAFAKFIAAAQRGDAIEVYGDGRQTRDFTFVSDAVEATIRAGAVDDPKQAVFNVGGGSRVPVLDVLRILGEILGTTLDVRVGPPQRGDVRDTGADLTRAEATLGWRPVVKLGDGLRAQVAAAFARRLGESTPFPS